MSNSEQEIKRLLELLAESNYLKNKSIREEAKVKSDLLKFVEDKSGKVSVDFMGKVKTYQYGDITTYEENIDPKELYEYMKKVGLESSFWLCIKPLIGKLNEVLSPVQVGRLSTTEQIIKKGVKELK